METGRQGQSHSGGTAVGFKAKCPPALRAKRGPRRHQERYGREDCTHSNCCKRHHLHTPGRDDKAPQILVGLFHLSHHSVSILNVSAHTAKQKHHQETPTGARRAASLMSSRLASVVSGDLFLRERSNIFSKIHFPGATNQKCYSPAGGY